MPSLRAIERRPYEVRGRIGVPARRHRDRGYRGRRRCVRGRRILRRLGQQRRRCRALVVHPSGRSPRWRRNGVSVNRWVEPGTRVVAAEPHCLASAVDGLGALAQILGDARERLRHKGPPVDSVDWRGLLEGPSRLGRGMASMDKPGQLSKRATGAVVRYFGPGFRSPCTTTDHRADNSRPRGPMWTNCEPPGA